jgi:hypothetical protein
LMINHYLCTSSESRDRDVSQYDVIKVTKLSININKSDHAQTINNYYACNNYIYTCILVLEFLLS